MICLTVIQYSETTRRPDNRTTRQRNQHPMPEGSHLHDTDDRPPLAGSKRKPASAHAWNPGLGGSPPCGTVPLPLPLPPPPPPPLPLTSPTLCRPLLLGAYALPSDVPLCSKVLLCDLSLLLPESDCKGFACGL
jgi:hypothetical protein